MGRVKSAKILPQAVEFYFVKRWVVVNIIMDLHHVDQGDKSIHEDPIVLSLMHEWPQATRAWK